MTRLLRRIGLAILLVVSACDKAPVTDLAAVQASLETVVGKTPLGDFGAVAFEAPAQADWFVLAPAGATAGAFQAAPDFLRAVGHAPEALLGRPEPVVAFVTAGGVQAEALHPAFTVKQVLAKPGRVTHGVRFVRLAGPARSYVIQSLQ